VLCRRTVLRLLFLLLPFAVLSGCAEPPPAPLLVASNVWTGYEPLYLARSLGYYPEGSVRLVELSSTTSVLHEMRNATVDVAALTLDEALGLVADGYAIEIVLVMDVSNGADALLAHPEITGLKDLRGRRVGVEDTAVGALLLESALESAGLDVTDIQPVHLAAGHHQQAYEQDQVAAVVTFEPTRSRLLAEGARVLFDSSRIPGRIIDVLVVREGLAAVHQEQLRALIRAYFRALDYLRKHPGDAARRMQARLRLAPSEILNSLHGLEQPDLAANRGLLTGRPAPLDTRAAELAGFLYRHRLLPREIGISGLASPRYLPPVPP